jgi:predicted ABC-type ATPase
MNQPQLITIAGQNGAGKSTVTQRYRDNNLLPSNYINPDEIVLNMTDIVEFNESRGNS